jgi:hypothetical protein
VRSRHHAGRNGMAVAADGQDAGLVRESWCGEHWIGVTAIGALVKGPAQNQESRGTTAYPDCCCTTSKLHDVGVAA